MHTATARRGQLAVQVLPQLLAHNPILRPLRCNGRRRAGGELLSQPRAHTDSGAAMGATIGGAAGAGAGCMHGRRAGRGAPCHCETPPLSGCATCCLAAAAQFGTIWLQCSLSAVRAHVLKGVRAPTAQASRQHDAAYPRRLQRSSSALPPNEPRTCCTPAGAAAGSLPGPLAGQAGAVLGGAAGAAAGAAVGEVGRVALQGQMGAMEGTGESQGGAAGRHEPDAGGHGAGAGVEQRGGCALVRAALARARQRRGCCGNLLDGGGL